jgi:hypothetical protein
MHVYAILSEGALSHNNISQWLTQRWNWQNPRVTVELASFHFNPFQTKGAWNPLPSGLVTLSTVRTICPPEPPEPPSSHPYHFIPNIHKLSLHSCEIRCLMSNCSGYMLYETDCGFSVHSSLMPLNWSLAIYFSACSAYSSTLKMGHRIPPKHHSRTTWRDIPEDSSAF